MYPPATVPWHRVYRTVSPHCPVWFDMCRSSPDLDRIHQWIGVLWNAPPWLEEDKKNSRRLSLNREETYSPVLPTPLWPSTMTFSVFILLVCRPNLTSEDLGDVAFMTAPQMVRVLQRGRKREEEGERDLYSFWAKTKLHSSIDWHNLFLGTDS